MEEWLWVAILALAFPSDEVSIVGVVDHEVLGSSKTLFGYEVEVLAVDRTFTLFGLLLRSSIEIWVPIPNTNQHDEPVIWVSIFDKLWHASKLELYLVVKTFVSSYGDCLREVLGSFWIHLYFGIETSSCCCFGIQCHTSGFFCFVALISSFVVVELSFFFSQMWVLPCLMCVFGNRLSVLLDLSCFVKAS